MTNGNIHAVDGCFIHRQALIWIAGIKSVCKLSLRSDHCVQALSLYMCVYTHTHTHIHTNIHTCVFITSPQPHTYLYLLSKSLRLSFHNFKFL